MMAGETRGKPIRCRAAVCWKAGEPLVMEEVMVAPPLAGEVRIRIICTSLCYSDITFWKLKVRTLRDAFREYWAMKLWRGENVSEVTEGDIVLPIFLPDCGECTDCRSEKSNLCSKFPFKVSPWMPRYESSRFTDLKERACLFSCGVSTGVGAAWKTANVEKGSTVAIFGLGAIGLALSFGGIGSRGARLCGASRIIGVDLNPDKFEIGKKFGVTDFVNSGNCGNKPVKQVFPLTHALNISIVLFFGLYSPTGLSKWI
ncbi:Alcohol dehydrogenase-like 7 [Vitis vinifera]|uniref:Alcohol dehydrogenase-like 7 n=1 Tax=Vitis vinifera TaxID=29760 RepID=A0A438K4D2_VITVI|nr:Alcohol dehydrogenase-like 7 [Vitis vinifera]